MLDRQNYICDLDLSHLTGACRLERGDLHSLSLVVHARPETHPLTMSSHHAQVGLVSIDIENSFPPTVKLTLLRLWLQESFTGSTCHLSLFNTTFGGEWRPPQQAFFQAGAIHVPAAAHAVAGKTQPNTLVCQLPRRHPDALPDHHGISLGGQSRRHWCSSIRYF